MLNSIRLKSRLRDGASAAVVVCQANTNRMVVYFKLFLNIFLGQGGNK